MNSIIFFQFFHEVMALIFQCFKHNFLHLLVQIFQIYFIIRCGLWILNQNSLGKKKLSLAHLVSHHFRVKGSNFNYFKTLQVVSWYGFLQNQWYSLCPIFLLCKFVLVGQPPNLPKTCEVQFWMAWKH